MEDQEETYQITLTLAECVAVLAALDDKVARVKKVSEGLTGSEAIAVRSTIIALRKIRAKIASQQEKQADEYEQAEFGA